MNQEEEESGMLSERILTKVSVNGRVRPLKYKKVYGEAARVENECHTVSGSLNGEPVKHDGSKNLTTASEDFTEINSDDTGIHKILNDLFQDYVIHHEQPDNEVPIDTEEDVEVLYYDKLESDADSSGLSGDEPIHAGHWMSVKISVMLIWMFVIEHAVTGAQLSDLLTLLSLHCLSAYPGLVSIYKLKLFFTSLRAPLQKHYFCRNCHAPVTIDFGICPNRFCNANLSQSGARSFFLVIPLHTQITSLFSRKDFAKCIGHRFARVKHNQNNIEDIYDSYVYKQLCDHDGPLSAKFPYNLSFTCNTDGIPLFKSSKYSIWPVYLMINELPYYSRKQQSNMLLYGLWFGESKPTMSTFCQPLHEMLSDLETVGVTVDVSGKPETCKCFLICLTADLPAKSLIMNTLQFNGNYSCCRCLQQGQNHRTTNGANVHIFPYVHADPVGPPRTVTQCVEDAKLACTSQTAVHGIKGPSFLMFMNSFNFVRSTSVDYMHCILLGVTKLLLTLWFSASHRDSKFSMYDMVHKVDERLQDIRPPSYISRLPRSISCHLKFWKASELRSWLLYYSLPILKDCMLYPYLYHYASLVETVYILSSSSISEQDIQLCHRNVRYFVYLFGELYGERYLTLNIHSLLHLPEVVCDIGPLWAHSCFPMESANGNLLKLFHGTQYVDVQILNAINLSNMMPRLVVDVQVGNPAYKFVHKMSNILAYGQLSANKVQGKCYDKKLAETQYGLINSLFGCISNNFHVSFYKRLRRNCIVYNSRDYARVKKRNSYTVAFNRNGQMCAGYINRFGVHVAGCACSNKSKCTCTKSLFACVTPFELIPLNLSGTADSSSNLLLLRFNHLCCAKVQDAETIMITVDCLVELCVCIQIDDALYICMQPNKTRVKHLKLMYAI